MRADQVVGGMARSACGQGRSRRRHAGSGLLLAAAACILAACGTAQDGPGERIACTQDAMQCPDGSWVGRSGPQCEFVCPQSQQP